MERKMQSPGQCSSSSWNRQRVCNLGGEDPCEGEDRCSGSVISREAGLGGLCAQVKGCQMEEGTSSRATREGGRAVQGVKAGDRKRRGSHHIHPRGDRLLTGVREDASESRPPRRQGATDRGPGGRPGPATARKALGKQRPWGSGCAFRLEPLRTLQRLFHPRWGERNHGRIRRGNRRIRSHSGQGPGQRSTSNGKEMVAPVVGRTVAPEDVQVLILEPAMLVSHTAKEVLWT